MDLDTSIRISKVEAAIRSLPDTPHKHIYWIVYNSEMIPYTESLITSIKGEEYLEHITVVNKGDSSKNREHGTIWFDPGLLDIIGNGYG